MIWFCGGHGACLTNSGPSRLRRGRDHQLVRALPEADRSVDTGPRFQWIADDGAVRTASRLPAAAEAAGHRHRARARSPSRPTRPAPGPRSPRRPATNAVRVPIPAPAAGSQIVGAPKLTLTYSGLANQTSVLLYAQIVDNAAPPRGRQHGHAVPRGARRRAAHGSRVSLEDIAASVERRLFVQLEIVPYTAVYGPQRAAGAITMSRIDISLPVVNAG